MKLNARQIDAILTTQGRYSAVCDGRTRRALQRRGLVTANGRLTVEGEITFADLKRQGLR